LKKRISMLLAAAMLVSALCMTGAAAADTTAATSESIGSDALTVKYNGEAIVFPDAQPFIDENNRTLIPVRFVAETMGADVSWNQEEQSAVIEQNGITVFVPIGSDTISITQDGSTSTVKMDTAALIREERTYVPIRYVAEALGAWVGYSDLYTTVQIYRDVLTPDEITRLHSYYDMTWEEYYKSIGETTALTDADIQDVSSSHSIGATFASAASLSAGGVALGDGGSGTLKSGNVTKSGYGITASLPVTASCVSGTTVTASYSFTSAKTVSLENVGGVWQFPVNGSSVTGARKIYIPVETKDGTYTITFTVKALDPQATALTGSNVYLTSVKSVTITIKGSMFEDDLGNS